MPGPSRPEAAWTTSAIRTFGQGFRSAFPGGRPVPPDPGRDGTSRGDNFSAETGCGLWLLGRGSLGNPELEALRLDSGLEEHRHFEWSRHRLPPLPAPMPRAVALASLRNCEAVEDDEDDYDDEGNYHDDYEDDYR